LSPLPAAATGFDEDQLASSFVLKIRNYRKKQALLSENIILLRDVDPEAKIPEGHSSAPVSGWSNAERQRIQVRCAREGNTSSPVVDIGGLRAPLLKYCELDTLAMVMLWQTWKHDHAEGSLN